MKIKINPKYEEMRSFIERIPDVFEQEGRCIFEGRNVIKAFHVKFDGKEKEVVVKRYKQPNFIQKIGYSFFRSTKAFRAYENALRLMADGFATPEGFGYIETRVKGLIDYCYFISDIDNSMPINDQLNSPEEFNRVMAADYAHFVNRLHQKGIIDIDLNAGNVLYQLQADGHYTFSLIDINRMRFYSGYPPMKECVENLTRFTGRMDVFECVAREYVKLRGMDEKILQKIIGAKKIHDWRWVHRKSILHYFKRKKVRFMKTTLLITTYNWPKALELVLYSVLHQHVMPDEVVIADDGSTEETKKLIDRYAEKMPVPVIWVWQEDKGFRRTSILNKAIAKATGDYIIQVDGDVVLSSHFVEDHIEMAQKGCFVCGSRVLLSAQISKKILDTKVVNVNLWNMPFSYVSNSFRSHVFRRLLAFRYARRIDHLRGCNMAYWREDAIKVNGYNEDLLEWGHEDAEFAYRLHFAGVRKKALKMGGIMYHLYHKEASKAQENMHKDVLNQVKKERLVRCTNGIDQYL